MAGMKDKEITIMGSGLVISEDTMNEFFRYNKTERCICMYVADKVFHNNSFKVKLTTDIIKNSEIGRNITVGDNTIKRAIKKLIEKGILSFTSIKDMYIATNKYFITKNKLIRRYRKDEGSITWLFATDLMFEIIIEEYNRKLN